MKRVACALFVYVALAFIIPTRKKKKYKHATVHSRLAGQIMLFIKTRSMK